ncbi:MAG: hypothetical protein H6626_08415 [Pseudobdellovibrionaceae bacterium]|nr:MAG: hypothetical protein H6626_08415 [Pseudobdellovibrionaceae bacterium]
MNFKVNRLLVFAAVLVASGSVEATKSRLEALGQSSSGSYYVDDDRNIFLNPARLFSVKDKVVFEWGAAGATTVKTDGPANPKAEGGLFLGSPNFSYGFYLGDENPEIIAMRNRANTTLLKPDNTLGLFVGPSKEGGSVNTIWGAHLSYSGNKIQNGALEQDEQMLVVKGGTVLSENTDVFGHLSLLDTAKGTTTNNSDEWTGSLGFKLGASHDFSKFRLFGHYASLSGEFDPSAGAKTDHSGSELVIGASRKKTFGEGAALFYALQYQRVFIGESPEGGTKTETTAQMAPVLIAVEAPAASWLTLRGAIQQAILINSTETKAGSSTATSSTADTTSVSAGMTISFDKFAFDGSFTTTGGTLNATNLMSRVGMNYTF